MDKKENPKKNKKQLEIKTLDIDKAEYQEIVLSNSNTPDDEWKWDENR